jgi:peptidoglycan/LPS O-acetylase OafA/YrhL
MVVAVTAGLTLLTGPYLEERNLLFLLLIAFGSLLLLFPVLGAGITVMAWPTDTRSPESRKPLIRMGIFQAALSLAGVACFVVFAILTGAPPWIPVVALAVLVVLFPVSIASGEAIRRRLASKPRLEITHWGLSPEEAETWRRRMIVAFCLGLIAGLVLVVEVAPQIDSELIGPAGFAVVLGLALFVAGAASLPTPFKLTPRLREAVRSDPALAVRVRKAIARNRSDDLEPTDRIPAARWAAVSVDFWRVNLAQSVLIFGGMLLIQIPALMAPSKTFGPIVQPVLASLLLAILVTSLLLGWHQLRRVRAYAELHSELIADPAVSPPETPGATSAPPR